MMKFNIFFLALGLLVAANSGAAEKTTIRIGVQAFGTVDWELSAIPNDPAADFQLDIHTLANAEAGKIALQSGAVDMIVSDWLWVSRLRATGADFTFYPYSTASGALVIPESSAIHSLADLKGKRVGIAGGELDKNWLLLQALAQKQQLDLNTAAEKVFGAPPLISEQIKRNRIDAALTYWHFAARLEAQGYKPLINGKGILQGLGITEAIPSVGYVFKESWANAHKQAVNNFFKASKQAKNKLCTEDAAWQKVLPLTKADDALTQNSLRRGYCDGAIEQWGEPQQQAAARLYSLLYTLSDHQLTGASDKLSTGTFWTID